MTVVTEETLRERLDAGRVALGVLDNTYSPAVVELCGDLGVDFVWLDLEHGSPSPWDASALENFARAAERSGTELLIRIPTADPELVHKVLDTGPQPPSLARRGGRRGPACGPCQPVPHRGCAQRAGTGPPAGPALGPA